MVARPTLPTNLMPCDAEPQQPGNIPRARECQPLPGSYHITNLLLQPRGWPGGGSLGLTVSLVYNLESGVTGLGMVEPSATEPDATVVSSSVPADRQWGRAAAARVPKPLETHYQYQLTSGNRV